MKLMQCLGLGLFLINCSATYAETQAPEPRNETEARNLQTMRLWGEEVWGKGRLELVPELVTPRYTREEYASEIEENRARGMTFTTHAMTIDNNLLWTRWSADVTILGFDLAVQGIQIYRFDEGRLTETWALIDIGDHWPDN